MLVPIPLVFALMAEDHLAICLRGAHGDRVTAVTRVLVAMYLCAGKANKGQWFWHFAGPEKRPRWPGAVRRWQTVATQVETRM